VAVVPVIKSLAAKRQKDTGVAGEKATPWERANISGSLPSMGGGTFCRRWETKVSTEAVIVLALK